MASDMSAVAVIEDGVIVIRVPIANLQTALDGAHALGAVDGKWKITDENLFAKDWVLQLNSEDEEGTTMIHKMFDAAFNEALEQGALGIEECEDQDAD